MTGSLPAKTDVLEMHFPVTSILSTKIRSEHLSLLIGRPIKIQIGAKMSNLEDLEKEARKNMSFPPPLPPLPWLLIAEGSL